MRNIPGFEAALIIAVLTFSSPSVADQGYNRTIRITPSTKWVNVSEGETVRFVSSATGESIVLNIGRYDMFWFDLAAMSPPGFLGNQRVRVYVQDNNKSDD